MSHFLGWSGFAVYISRDVRKLWKRTIFLWLQKEGLICFHGFRSYLKVSVQGGWCFGISLTELRMRFLSKWGCVQNIGDWIFISQAALKAVSLIGRFII